jgi:hypothetical protein
MSIVRRLATGALVAAGLALAAASPATADNWKHHNHGGWGNGHWNNGARGGVYFNSGGYYTYPGYYYAQPYYYQPPVYYYPAPVYAPPPPPPPVYYQPAPVYQGPSFNLVLPFHID